MASEAVGVLMVREYGAAGIVSARCYVALVSRRRTARSLSRQAWISLLLVVATAVFVAVGALRDRSSAEPSSGPAAPSAGPSAGAPLAGVRIVAARERAPQPYRRAAFGKAWTDDQSAPLGHNGCDTRIIYSEFPELARRSALTCNKSMHACASTERATCGTSRR
ncbi:hypothetical protein AXK56_16280 [Tsukamurella pulmonis]|nr:hypothetical protein AXK56_16280 [Tsukamurella pulmonis]